MTRHDARKKLFQSLGACFLAFVMILTNVLGAVEVQAAGVKKPTIDPVPIGAKKVTGGNLEGVNKRKKFNKDCIIHVTVKNADQVIETATVSIAPNGGSKWEVQLTNETKAGYKVYVKQEFNGEFSAEATREAKQLLADSYRGKLTMPKLEVWSENVFVLDADAVEDIIKAFKEANNALALVDNKNFEGNLYVNKGGYDKKQPLVVAGDGKSITVNFSDGSSIENIDISDKVTVNKITEVSTAPIINTLKVVDSKITGKVDLTKVAAPEKLKVEIVTDFGETKPKDFCTDQGCSIDKGTKVFATINPETGEFSYDIGNDKVELGKDFGVIVKEYGKKNNCGTIQPELVIPKVDVRDPGKVTKEEKKAIDKAIRDANKVGNVSKLPDGTGENKGIPAVIEIDDQGNVKVISGNDVEVKDWDSDGKAIAEKNPDGSVKLKKDTSPVKKAEPKEVLNNLPPNPPKVELSDDNKNITITPDKADTDAKEVSASYEAPDGTKKTITATKGDDGTWSVPADAEGKVDQNGVITLPTNKVKGETEVKASVKDDGFKEAQQAAGESSNGTLIIPKAKTKAEQVTELGGLGPVDLKKWVGDEIKEGFWKDGVKANNTAKETDVNNLLTGATFTDATDTARSTDSAGKHVGKIRVKFDDDSELIVDNQTLYVSNHVTSATDANVPSDALEVEFKLGEGTKVENSDGTEIKGDKANPTSYSKYKVKPGTNLETYQVPGLNSSVVATIKTKLKPQEGYVDPVWTTQNFVASDTNKVFTATATKAYKVTFEPNGGSGTMSAAQVKEHGTYKLPENSFNPPNENQEFAGWLVNGATTVTEPGTDITITGNIVVKASWKPIEYKVTFDGNSGSGKMDAQTVKKGDGFKLPDNGFTAPNGKEFAGWQVGSETKKAGETIALNANITVKAVWKDKSVAPRWNNSAGFIFPRSEAKEMEIGRHYRYLYGYTDKTVRPEGNITRAEAAALIARLAGLDMSDDSKPNFADTPSRWYNSAINIMVKMDLMFADKDGNFRPNEAITRAEFARALYYVDKKNDKVAPFADVKGHVYEDAINQAYGNGRINGYPDGTFRPDAKIQRAEVARILNQYANRGTTLEGMAGVAKDLIQFTDITPSHWAYCEVMEAANNHEYQREKGTQLETWLRILPLDLKIAK